MCVEGAVCVQGTERRRLDLGGEYPIQCTDEVLWNCVQMMCCAPETCIILLTSVTAVNSIRRRKKEGQCDWAEASEGGSVLGLERWLVATLFQILRVGHLEFI